MGILTMRITSTVFVLLIQTFLCLASDGNQLFLVFFAKAFTEYRAFCLSALNVRLLCPPSFPVFYHKNCSLSKLSAIINIEIS